MIKEDSILLIRVDQISSLYLRPGANNFWFFSSVLSLRRKRKYKHNSFLLLSKFKFGKEKQWLRFFRSYSASGTCFCLSPLKKQRNLNFQFKFIHDQIARRRDRLMGTIHRLVTAHHDHLEQLTVRMISRHLEAYWLNLNYMDDWASNLGLLMAAWFLEEECLWFVAAVLPQRCPCRRHLASPFSYGADCYAVLILFPSLSLSTFIVKIYFFHISTLPKTTQYWLPSCNM